MTNNSYPKLIMKTLLINVSLLPAVFYSQQVKKDSLRDTSDIQTVEIIGRKAKNYKSDYSFVATKIAIKNKDLPQTVNTITKELIKDRNAFQLVDAVKTVSGVAPTNYYNHYSIRGITQNQPGQIINGMRTYQHYYLQPLTANIERVEVLKGAGSITLSSVDPGGSINMVTKKPLAERRNELTLSGGSFKTYRVITDNTGALNDSKTLLYRFTGAYQSAKSFRDYVNNSGFLVSPSLTYLLGNKTKINAELIYNELNGNLDRGQPIFGAVAGKTNLNSTPISLNLGSPNDYFKTKDLTIIGSIAHTFNDNITFNTSVMRQTWNEDLKENRTTNGFVPDINGKNVPSLAMMRYAEEKQKWVSTNLTAYFNFKFKTGDLQHQALLGYDFNSWEKKGGYQNQATGFLLKDGSVASKFDKTKADNYQTFSYNGLIIPKPNVTPFDLTAGVSNVRNESSYIMNNPTALPTAYTTTQSAYIQHLITWNKLNIITGIRHEWFKDITNYKSKDEFSFTNSAFIYRFGVNYGITDNFNVYGTYLTGFQPQSNTVGYMPATGSFNGSKTKSAAMYKPLTSDLLEFGVKSNFFNNALNVNLAVYKINQKNILMNANNPQNPDELTQRGADQSRGFEAEIVGKPSKDWSIFAGYSYIDAVIKNDANAKLIEQRKENTPKNSFSLWTRYNFSEIELIKNFGIGFGMQYQSSRIPWYTRDFELPAYSVLDAALYYAPKNGAFQISLNVNNIANTNYWLGAINYLRLYPGAPRNYMLTASFRF